MKNDMLNFWKSYLICELSTEYYDSKEWKTNNWTGICDTHPKAISSYASFDKIFRTSSYIGVCK